MRTAHFLSVPPEGRMKESFIYRRLIRPILELLQQGVTPEKLALSLALGLVIGVFPAVGWTTTLCALAALIFRLNIPAIQMINYFMYPAQIALLLPFFRLGEKVFRAPHLAISLPHIYEMVRADHWGAIRFLWITTWHAIVVWAVLAPLSTLLIYYVLVPVFRRVARRIGASMPAAEAKGA
jgi:uncharacterized protein (DUF2062 family)